ncbi:MAG: ATP-binding protein [Planctomycetota bacterium]
MVMSPAQSESHGLEAASPTLTHIAEEVFRSIPLAVVVFDRSLRIIHRNETAALVFPGDGDVSELLAKGAAEDRYQDWASELRRVMETGTPRRFDGVGYASDPNEQRLLDVSCVPLRDDEPQRIVGAVLFCEDVTHRAGLERRLAVSERMAAVGRLGARVAHELNNPLDGVLRYVNMALRVLEKDGPEKALGFLKESRTGLMRMAQIVSELLEFSRSSAKQFEEANINDVVDEAIRTFQEPAAGQGVVFAAVFRDQHMPRIRGARLFQVCCNLIKNAIDVMPAGGTLTITTGVVGREVVLKFEDTGTGLPENTEVIFEPFYTTKASGKGTGLGLAICRDYVARLNGTITAANRPEGGAVFTLRIPVESCDGLRPDVLPDRRQAGDK